MTPVTPLASAVPPAIEFQTSVKTVVPVMAGTTNIPSGTNGTVIAVLGVGSTYEISFGPPVSTTETVAQNLLAIA
jgi:hypothetical protein